MRGALLFGNFVVACGVMAAAGTLTDVSRSLGVSVSLAGQLVAAGGAAVCFGAPLFAGWVAAFDRRKLLAVSLVGYAIGHALCAAMPSYAALLPVRAATLLGAAVFTPQAAAAIGFMTPPAERGRAIAFIFLGWSLASVLGLPLSALVGELFGWRVAYLAIAVLSLAAAAWVHAAMPGGIKLPALTSDSWRRVFGDPLLLAILGVTLLAGLGQFTIFSYLMPYFRNVAQASPLEASLLLGWYGIFGVVGNVVLARVIDRIGVHAAATLTLVPIAVSFLFWPLAAGVIGLALVSIPWALGCFSANSSQQARLNLVAPQLASALIALNTSAIYLGQAGGAATGGWLVAHGGYGWLAPPALAAIVAAIALSAWAGRAATRRAAAA